MEAFYVILVGIVIIALIGFALSYREDHLKRFKVKIKKHRSAFKSKSVIPVTEKIAGCFKKYTQGKKISIEKDIEKALGVAVHEVAKKDVEKDAAMGIIGLGGSEKGNLSSEHDRYLVKHTVLRKR